MGLPTDSEGGGGLFSERNLIAGFAIFNTAWVVLYMLYNLQTGNKTKYGRYSDAKQDGGIFFLPISPKLLWLLMEIPNLINGGWMMYHYQIPLTEPKMIFPLLFMLHYVFRVVLFGFRLRGGKEAPLHFLLLGASFTMINGMVQVAWHARYADYPAGYVYSPQFIVGIFLFFLGMTINHHSDGILRNLRKSDSDKNHYIPHGGLFEYVSGVNFFGEAIEWLGYAIASNTVVAWGFFFSSAANIGVRAMNHHEWYLEKFKDEYPKTRKAYIPFVI